MSSVILLFSFFLSPSTLKEHTHEIKKTFGDTPSPIKPWLWECLICSARSLSLPALPISPAARPPPPPGPSARAPLTLVFLLPSTACGLCTYHATIQKQYRPLVAGASSKFEVDQRFPTEKRNQIKSTAITLHIYGHRETQNVQPRTNLTCSNKAPSAYTPPGGNVPGGYFMVANAMVFLAGSLSHCELLNPPPPPSLDSVDAVGPARAPDDGPCTFPCLPRDDSQTKNSTRGSDDPILTMLAVSLQMYTVVGQ